LTGSDHPLLALSDVHKHYYLPKKQVLRAVNGVSLELSAGECLAVVGESGCGKSTLARMVAGVEPATTGEILFEGRSVKGLKGESLRELRRKTQMIFQDPISIFSPRMRIGEFLREPYLNYRIASKKEAAEKALFLLESVELSGDFLSRYPHELSGGELQRVAIARALALSPPLLICDEPTSALDVSIQERIVGLLEAYLRRRDIAMLFISHDLALVSHFCDRILVMYLGYVMEEFPRAMLNGGTRHPYTKGLIDSVFSVDMEQGKEIEGISGETPSAIDLPPGCPYGPRCPQASAVCGQDVPVLKEVAPGHKVACVLADG